MRALTLSALVLSVIGLASASQIGCKPTPTSTVLPGSVGVFVRAIPPKGGLSADARSGVVGRPDKWPPTVGTGECKDGVFEDKDLAASLGFSPEPVSCPWADAADVKKGAPSTGAVSDGDVEIPKTDGFSVSCHALGEWMIVLETTTRIGKCSHVVGVSLFRNSP